MKTIIAFATLAAVVATARATPPAAVRYPDGFRRWVHVKSAIVGPASPAHARYGGIHHIYANEAAIRGYESGHFPEGSMIVFDRLEVVNTVSDVAEGKRLSIDVMERDSARFAATGGWGFERFDGDGRVATLDSTARGGCYRCHAGPGTRDLVFSRLRP